MNSIPDACFDVVSEAGYGAPKAFDQLWTKLDTAEGSDAAVERESVLLECSGDLVDASSLEIVGIRRAEFDSEMLRFVCPQCREPHESLRFR